MAAWEEVESVRQALRLKDAELASALEALAAAQAFGESPGAVQRHSETAGQQLARFLKDQLAMRDGQLAAAQAEAAELRAALADSEERRAQLEAALAEAQADANYARLETEEARRDAAAQLAAMRSELWAAEARANLAAYGTPEGEQLGAERWGGVCGAWAVCEQTPTLHHDLRLSLLKGWQSCISRVCPHAHGSTHPPPYNPAHR